MCVIPSLQHNPFSAISSGSAEELLQVKFLKKNHTKKTTKHKQTNKQKNNKKKPQTTTKEYCIMLKEKNCNKH